MYPSGLKERKGVIMEMIKLTDITSNGNVRIGDKSKEKEYKIMKRSIAARGVELPITVVQKNGVYVLLDGHQRVQISEELGLKEIRCTVMPEDTDTRQHQLAANMFSVPMSAIEASKSVGEILKEKPGITRQDIADMFGKNIGWVKRALQYNNLIKPLQTKKYLNEDYARDMFDISTYSQYDQKEAYKRLVGDVSKWGSGNLIWKLKRILDQAPSFSVIKKLVDEDVFRKYEKDAKVKFQKTMEIFGTDEDYCSDPDFLREVFLKETLVGRHILKDVPIAKHELSGYDRMHINLSLDEWKSQAKFNKKMDGDTDYKGAGKGKWRLVEWNGYVLSPTVKWAHVKVAGKTSTATEERPKYYGQDKRFLNVVAPLVVGQMQKVNTQLRERLPKDPKRRVRKDGIGNHNITFKWMLMNQHFDTHSSYLTFNRKGCKNKTEVEVINSHMDKWYSNIMLRNSFYKCDLLFKEQGMTPIRTIVRDRFEEDSKFREAVYSCFTIKNLSLVPPHSLKGKSKKDLVKYLTSKQEKFTFEDIWKDLPRLCLSALPSVREMQKGETKLGVKI